MAEKVALMADIKPVAREIFESAGFDVATFPKFADGIKPSDYPDEVKEAFDNATIIGIRSGPHISGETLATYSTVGAIGCFAVGTNVDFETANKEGVAIFNAGHENTRSVAEFVIASAFALVRRIPEHDASLQKGVWNKTDKASHELRGMTLGIIGYGTVGAQAGVLAESIGVNVIAYDPKSKIPPMGRAKLLDSREEVLTTADIVSLHVPTLASTFNMINDESLALMRKGSYLINTARGEVVDENALRRAIENGHLGGAAIDVFRKEQEPAKKGDSFRHILQGLPNVILSSHIAGSTQEAQLTAGKSVAEKLVDYWLTGNPTQAINLPDAAFKPPIPGIPRVTYIHDNKPGALKQAQDILAQAGCNVSSETSQAERDLGYAYFDIDNGKLTHNVVEAIKHTSAARRVRVIE